MPEAQMFQIVKDFLKAGESQYLLIVVLTADEAVFMQIAFIINEISFAVQNLKGLSCKIDFIELLSVL